MASGAVTPNTAASPAVEDYRFDDFDDGTAKAHATLQQAASLSSYVEEFLDQLWNVEDAISETMPRSLSSRPLAEPIALNLVPREQTTLLQLAQTPSRTMNKLVSLFSYLICELRDLRKIAETKFFGPLALFGAQTEEEEQTEGSVQMGIGRLMPLFTELTSFIARVYVVVCNAVRQLASLYHPKQRVYASIAKSKGHLLPVYEALAETFESLLSLESIVLGNPALVAAWSKYNMMMKPVLKDPARFGTDSDQVQRLDMLLKSIHSTLFEEMLFVNCIQQPFDYEDTVEVRGNKVFARESAEMIGLLFRRALRGVLGADGGDSDEQQQLAGEVRALPGLFGLLALHTTVWGPMYLDKKFCREVVALAQAVPLVPLWGKGVWFPLDFIADSVPVVLQVAGARLGSPTAPDGPIMRAKQEHLAKTMKRFKKWVQEYTTYVAVWMARIESNVVSRTNFKSSIDLRIRLMREGLFLAGQIRGMFQKVVGLHSSLKAQLAVKDLLDLCNLVVLLKSIEGTFRRKMSVFGELSSLMYQRVSYAILRVIDPIRHELKRDTRLSGENLDVLATLTMSVSMLRGCTTRERRTVLRVALALATGTKNGIRESQTEQLERLLQQLDAVSDVADNLSVCDTYFLYWTREIVPFELAHIYENPEHNMHALQPMLDALSDIAPYMERAVHLPPVEGTGENPVVARYRDEVLNKFLRPKIIEPLQRAIDEDLRLQTHLHLKVADKNPFRAGVCSFGRLLSLPPLLFLGVSIDLKSECSDFLDRTFYNTNTVALFDWKTYEEMRQLGRTKYGLPLADAYLPSGTLEQGLDVLEVMRNIHVFVGKYHYNMNSQFFVEHQSESKTLNTIGISTLANSIRTHGTGIMNTTVNFTYQYLRTMFDSFSQFLFDEHIKSPLMKEIKFFHDLQVESGAKQSKNGPVVKSFYQSYPFDRADRFNKEIRKLGTTTVEGGSSLTFLDRFRILVTQIGNAMGYIRMVRSGGLLAVANAIKYVPVLSLKTDVTKFGSLVEKDHLSGESVAAGQNVDLSIENLTQSFVGQGFEYFKLLVDVFAPEFQSADSTHHHLSNFYIIIPALTLNYVEYLLTAKDRVIKKSSQLHSQVSESGGYVFCDDGFAIGIAYILKLLDQTAQFDALHWFDSVKDHYKGLITKLDQQSVVDKRASRKEKLEQQQTTVLNQKKLAAYLREFDLLKYSFAGAKIFFDN